MKHIIIILLACTLTACGAGQAVQDSTLIAVRVEASPMAYIEGFPSELGSTPQDREYDAVAYVVSTIKPGTHEYSLMLSDRGLYVYVQRLEGMHLYIVHMKADGLHIDGGE